MTSFSKPFLPFLHFNNIVIISFTDCIFTVAMGFMLVLGQLKETFQYIFLGTLL